MDTSKTPRTDAQQHHLVDFGIAVDVNFAKQLEIELNRAKWLLSQIIQDLPEKRDWLNPDIEKESRSAILTCDGFCPDLGCDGNVVENYPARGGLCARCAERYDRDQENWRYITG